MSPLAIWPPLPIAFGLPSLEAHTLTAELHAEDEVVALPVTRGSITVHNERIVHGSSGNHSSGWRRTYVIAHRSRQTVACERSIGFTHSHNDVINWQTNLEALEVAETASNAHAPR